VSPVHIGDAALPVSVLTADPLWGPADGGGPRALSQLELLGRIMYLIQYDRNDADSTILPCDYFDMMGGSDTGG
jgi:hypothetical protein